MKAFKKWNNKQNPYSPCTVNQIREQTWKAALEWALEQTDTGETDLFPVINPRWLRYELENRKPPEEDWNQSNHRKRRLDR